MRTSGRAGGTVTGGFGQFRNRDSLCGLGQPTTPPPPRMVQHRKGWGGTVTGRVVVHTHKHSCTPTRGSVADGLCQLSQSPIIVLLHIEHVKPPGRGVCPRTRGGMVPCTEIGAWHRHSPSAHPIMPPEDSTTPQPASPTLSDTHYHPNVAQTCGISTQECMNGHAKV